MKEMNLSRFLEAQAQDYTVALQEVKRGRKTSHWMWYIFPQVKGLGRSEAAVYYAINNIAEATAYLNHPVLGTRLEEITHVLLQLPTNDPVAVFGGIDSVKLRSCMTLFSLVENTSPVFQQVLDKYFGGVRDRKTLDIISG
jgi:uncharacterized protein (DUF1810 family)